MDEIGSERVEERRNEGMHSFIPSLHGKDDGMREGRAYIEMGRSEVECERGKLGMIR